MLAMSLLMVDFVLLPVSFVVLVVLLVVYARRWSAWRAAERAAAGADPEASGQKGEA